MEYFHENFYQLFQQKTMGINEIIRYYLKKENKRLFIRFIRTIQDLIAG